jgi:hypothetical protein
VGVPVTADQLRDRIAAAIEADCRKALPPAPHPLGGPPLGGWGRSQYDIADAVLAVVQPELDRLQAELAAARVSAFREAARLLEATGRDDDAVNLLDLVAGGITTHATSACGCVTTVHPGHYPSCTTRTARES